MPVLGVRRHVRGGGEQHRSLNKTEACPGVFTSLSRGGGDII